MKTSLTELAAEVIARTDVDLDELRFADVVDRLVEEVVDAVADEVEHSLGAFEPEILARSSARSLRQGSGRR